MDLALCYESVLPAKGGAETYLSDLSRRLVRDGHRVTLFAARWDARALPGEMNYCRIAVWPGPRFLRPWRFARACLTELRRHPELISMGFDKTFGQDVLYPQGGLHAASRDHNRRKFSSRFGVFAGDFGKFFDPARRSFAKLERRQYLGPDSPVIVANSEMVRGHFRDYYGLGSDRVKVVHSAIDPTRFDASDQPARRLAERANWGIADGESVGLMVAMNYRLKGLAPLIRAVAADSGRHRYRVAVVGHPDTRDYQRLARQLNVADRFLFLGFRADPRDAYFAADFLVHPTFYDPCSLVALEALACGLPVVTTRSNGANELLGGAGVVVSDPHDSLELAAAISLVADPAALPELAAKAKQAAAAWTFEDHYAALLAVVEEAADRKRMTATVSS